MPPKVRLYSLPISHYCVSAERMLAFKGVPTEVVPAAYHTRQELLRRTGQDYVPTLLWGRRTVLWHEIRACGYPSGYAQVRDCLVRSAAISLRPSVPGRSRGP